jgi:hypothetical protein
MTAIIFLAVGGLSFILGLVIGLDVASAGAALRVIQWIQRGQFSIGENKYRIEKLPTDG